TYITPMRLWSTLVSHSRHRYGHQPFTVTSASTARITIRTTAMLMRGSGSLNGIASQLSLPSMSTSSLTRWRTPCAPDSRVSGTRHRLVENVLKQLRHNRAIGCWWYVLTRLCQLGVPGIVKGGSSATHLLEPSVEIAGGHRLGDEPHVGKACAAEQCRKPGILTWPVGEQAQMRRHPAHRVDLTAELRDKEGIHHRRRSEPKFDGSSGGDDQLIDGRDARVGIDEQPFPIQRHDVDTQRIRFPGNRVMFENCNGH